MSAGEIDSSLFCERHEYTLYTDVGKFTLTDWIKNPTKQATKNKSPVAKTQTSGDMFEISDGLNWPRVEK